MLPCVGRAVQRGAKGAESFLSVAKLIAFPTPFLSWIHWWPQNARKLSPNGFEHTQHDRCSGVRCSDQVQKHKQSADDWCVAEVLRWVQNGSSNRALVPVYASGAG